MAKETSRRAKADSPKSAARYIRGSAEAILKGGARLSHYSAEKLALIEWAHARELVLPFSYIEQFDYLVSGAEHRVYKSDRESKLAIKATHCNRFGHSTEEEGKGATPVQYFKRLAWQNYLFGDDIRILGVCCDEENQVEIVTSQPWINAHEIRPNPTTGEIDYYMALFGFHPTLPDLGVPIYYSDVYKLIVGNANDRNVIRDVEGKLTAIDVVIGSPGERLREKISDLAIKSEPTVDEIFNRASRNWEK